MRSIQNTSMYCKMNPRTPHHFYIFIQHPQLPQPSRALFPAANQSRSRQLLCSATHHLGSCGPEFLTGIHRIKILNQGYILTKHYEKSLKLKKEVFVSLFYL